MEKGRIRAVYAIAQMPSLPTNFVYDYFLKDHLGNVRMELVEEQQIHHYPITTLVSYALIQEQKYYTIADSEMVPAPANAPVYINDNGTNNPSTSGTLTANSKRMYQLNNATNKKRRCFGGVGFLRNSCWCSINNNTSTINKTRRFKLTNACTN